MWAPHIVPGRESNTLSAPASRETIDFAPIVMMEAIGTWGLQPWDLALTFAAPSVPAWDWAPVAKSGSRSRRPLKARRIGCCRRERRRGSTSRTVLRGSRSPVSDHRYCPRAPQTTPRSRAPWFHRGTIRRLPERFGACGHGRRHSISTSREPTRGASCHEDPFAYEVFYTRIARAKLWSHVEGEKSAQRR